MAEGWTDGVSERWGGTCAVTFTVCGLSVINGIAGSYGENIPIICIAQLQRLRHQPHTSPHHRPPRFLRCFQTVTCYRAGSETEGISSPEGPSWSWPMHAIMPSAKGMVLTGAQLSHTFVCCIQDLIPGIGKAGEAPVAAVHARVISTVSGWMRVLSELGEQGYVEQIGRLRHGPEDAVDDALSWKWTTWVRRSSDRLRLFVTALCGLLSPVCSSGGSNHAQGRRTQSD
ncbi:hypothetical protein BHE74_00047711 [Ensete ventricosum]|nr:hypothetical protein GW17_00026237 [Ensete ventricosum]RWW46366.1 hypothetical protein BHE74_00047711 [Ensete ventricosum]